MSKTIVIIFFNKNEHTIGFRLFDPGINFRLNKFIKIASELNYVRLRMKGCCCSNIFNITYVCEM